MLDILYKVMEAGWRWEDHWQKWYRQSVDSILPLLAEGKLLVNDFATLHALFSLNSKFTVPLNSVLILLFTHQVNIEIAIFCEIWLLDFCFMFFILCEIFARAGGGTICIPLAEHGNHDVDVSLYVPGGECSAAAGGNELVREGRGR